MGILGFYSDLKRNKYFTDEYIYYKYETDEELKIFIIILDNIIEHINQKGYIGIRYNEQKKLLRVLSFMLNNYKLYKVDSKFMEGNYYANNYHNKPVGPREALIASLIHILSKSVGYVNKTSYNLCIDFIASYSNKLYNANINIDIIKRELRKELTFGGKYKLSNKGNISDKYYLN